MKRPLIALLLLPALLMAARAIADGRELGRECSQVIEFAGSGDFEQAAPGASYCLGMVKGMLTMNTIYQNAPGSTALFCPPERMITNADGARIVVDYLNAHPEQLHLDAGSLMFFAFQDAFPCKATSPDSNRQ